MISVLLGAAGAIAANPTGPETMVVQQGNKVTGLVEDQMGPVAGASVVVKGTPYRAPRRTPLPPDIPAP